MKVGPITRLRTHSSVRVKLYALGIPLAVLSGVLVIATVLPYRTTQDRLTRARNDIAAVMASRRVEQNTNETMWHTLRLVLTGDVGAARSIDHSQRASSEALDGWLSAERDPSTKDKIADMARQKHVLDELADRAAAAAEEGDLLTARETFYEDVYPTFDSGFDEDVDELLKRQDVQLRDGFNGLAGATGPGESFFGGKISTHVTNASRHVAHAELAADFVAELIDASVEMVEMALEGDPDLDDAEELRTEVGRVLASWERNSSRAGSATHSPIVERMLARFDALGRTEDAVLTHATDDDIDGAVELLAGPYANQLQRIVTDVERFIAGEEEEIAATIDGITGDARRSNALMAIGAIALFLIGGAFVVVLARKLSRRLGALTAAASRISAGDLSVRVDVDTPDELGELGRTFNTMGEELSDAHYRLASLFGGTVEAGEQERTRLAADLHDGPVQRLAAVGYVVERISHLVSRGELDTAEQLIDGLKQDISTEVRGLRQMMSELRPPALDTRGLPGAVDDYASEVGLHSDIEVTVDVCDERLAPALETTIYRVMQEALTNVAKHAHATAAQLTISREGDDVLLSVRDDGIGFDPAKRVDSATEHFGLDGMEQRVKIAGGQWMVESTLKTGTTVSARFPIPVEATEDTEPAQPRVREYVSTP